MNFCKLKGVFLSRTIIFVFLFAIFSIKLSGHASEGLTAYDRLIKAYNGSDSKLKNTVEGCFPSAFSSIESVNSEDEYFSHLKQAETIGRFLRVGYPERNCKHGRGGIECQAEDYVEFVLLSDMHSTCLVRKTIEELGWNRILNRSPEDVDAVWYALQHARAPDLGPAIELVASALPSLKRAVEKGVLEEVRYNHTKKRLKSWRERESRSQRRGEEPYAENRCPPSKP